MVPIEPVSVDPHPVTGRGRIAARPVGRDARRAFVSGPLRAVGLVAAVVVGVALSTLAVAVLEQALGVPDSSSLYVVAVAAVAILFGIAGAVLTAVLGVVVYDFLFTDPVHTLTVADPGEWLNLVLLLFVAVTVGQLAALQRRRAQTAVERDEESRAMFQVTRALATRESLTAAFPAVVEALASAATMDEVWVALGPDDVQERVVAQSGAKPLPRGVRAYFILHAPPGDSARWTLVRAPGASTRRGGGASSRLYRARIMESGAALGSIWAQRDQDGEAPDSRETALVLVAADLLAQALAHERLADERRRAEIAQQSDAVKTALLESVSHNLRTPLASIRASAGTLMDPDVRLSPADARASADSIDRAAQRLNRLVGNLLDLSRIEGGALRAAREAVDLDDVMARAFAQVEPRAGNRGLEVEIAPGTAVLGDPVLLEEVAVNLLDNAVQHTPAGTSIRASASVDDTAGSARFTIEDSGPGVPDPLLERIFEKFYRTGTEGSGRASGSGIGLAVVRGFVEAMGGTVVARRSALGGLAIDVDLPAASIASPGGEAA